MASLNLLRYLVIKDNENDNQVSELFGKEPVSILRMHELFLTTVLSPPLLFLPSCKTWVPILTPPVGSQAHLAFHI